MALSCARGGSNVIRRHEIVKEKKKRKKKHPTRIDLLWNKTLTKFLIVVVSVGINNSASGLYKTRQSIRERNE